MSILSFHWSLKLFSLCVFIVVFVLRVLDYFIDNVEEE